VHGQAAAAAAAAEVAVGGEELVPAVPAELVEVEAEVAAATAWEQSLPHQNLQMQEVGQAWGPQAQAAEAMEMEAAIVRFNDQGTVIGDR
jgi:hypothetical protein